MQINEGTQDYALGAFYIILFLFICGLSIWVFQISVINWLLIILIFAISYRWFIIGLCYIFGLKVEE